MTSRPHCFAALALGVALSLYACEQSDTTSDAGTAADAGAIGADANTERDIDSGPHEGSTDGGTLISDGGPNSGIAALLAQGNWEQVGFEDSGGPRMDTPAGNFFIFDGARVHFGCADPTGFAYTLLGTGIPGTTAQVTIGASTLNWRILELSATTFSFEEGPDVFHFENRSECVMVRPDPGP